MSEVDQPNPFGDNPDMTEFEHEWDEQRAYFQEHHSAELRDSAKVAAVCSGSLAVGSSTLLEISRVLPDTPGYIMIAKFIIFSSGTAMLGFSGLAMRESIHDFRQSKKHARANFEYWPKRP